MNSELAKKYLDLERELAKAKKEYDSFKKALGGNPHLTAYVDGRGRMPPRSLSSFEIATVKRLKTIERKIADLEFDEQALYVSFVESLANKQTDDAVQDPEVLLRASLVVMNKRFKTGDDSLDLRLVMRAVLDYLKSLALDDE